MDVPISETVYLYTIPVAVIRQGVVYTVHTDQLDTPRVISDPQGVTVWRWEGEPFGGTVADEDPDGVGVKFVFNGRFPGQYFDEETGLHYNYHRYYDPATGRYITSDPIGLKGGLNTYGYVRSNPLNLWDPYGLELKSGKGGLITKTPEGKYQCENPGVNKFTDDLIKSMNKLCKSNHYYCEVFDKLIGNTKYLNEYHPFEEGPKVNPPTSHTMDKDGDRSTPSGVDMYLKNTDDAGHEGGHGVAHNEGTHSKNLDTHNEIIRNEINGQFQ